MNGFAPNKQQAIIWINSDLIQWCIYAALGGDMLMIFLFCSHWNSKNQFFWPYHDNLKQKFQSQSMAELIYTFKHFCLDASSFDDTKSRLLQLKCSTWTNDDLVPHIHHQGGVSKNTYELLNLRALKFSYVNKIHIFQCMDKIFCVEFQRYPLKFHTKYLTHTLKDMIFMQFCNFKSS